MEEVYNQIVDIARRYNAKKVVLFGSRARGTNQPKSDIDLAVYGCEDFGELSDSLNEELWTLLKLDIINMDDEYVSSALIAEIERDGKILYENSCRSAANNRKRTGNYRNSRHETRGNF